MHNGDSDNLVGQKCKTLFRRAPSSKCLMLFQPSTPLPWFSPSFGSAFLRLFSILFSSPAWAARRIGWGDALTQVVPETPVLAVDTFQAASITMIPLHPRLPTLKDPHLPQMKDGDPASGLGLSLVHLERSSSTIDKTRTRIPAPMIGSASGPTAALLPLLAVCSVGGTRAGILTLKIAVRALPTSEPCDRALASEARVYDECVTVPYPGIFK